MIAVLKVSLSEHWTDNILTHFRRRTSLVKILLPLTVPVLLLTSGILDYYGLIDKITGRYLAQEGLKRLKSTKGYPTSFIYKEKKNDLKIFLQLEKRIFKNTKENEIQTLLKEGYKPKIITTGGSPIEIKGVPKEWSQDERLIYLPNQPILFIYKEHSLSKGIKSCTLEELHLWIEEEKGV